MEAQNAPSNGGHLQQSQPTTTKGLGDTTRRQNEESLQKVTTGDLSPGGVLPEGMFEEFFEEIQDRADLLNDVRTVRVGRQQTRIPKLGVGERVRRGQDEATGVTEANVQVGSVPIDTRKGSIYWSLTKEAVEENPERENLADLVFNQFVNQWAVDTQILGIQGDMSSGDPFLQQNDGWLKQARDPTTGMATYQHGTSDGSGGFTANPINTPLFNNMIQTMPDRVLNARNPEFLVSRGQLQAYHNSLAGTETDAAMAILMGSNDLTPFNYTIRAPAGWPDDEVMFTHTNNLVYGLRRDMEMDVLDQSDQIFDQDLYAKYALRARDDFVIEDTSAGVLAENIAAPTMTA